MTIDIKIVGTDGNTAQVTAQGALKIIPNEFSKPSKQSIIDANAVSFWPPKAGEKFIVTGVIVNTDRNIGVNGALIDIYEATSASSTDIEESIISIDQAKSVTSALLPLFTEVTEGRWVNGKSDDANVHVTVFGYYVNT